MKLPTFTEIKETTDNITSFNGLNLTNEIQESEFSDMESITLKEYPYLANRLPKSYLNVTTSKILGLLSFDDTLYVVSVSGIHVVTASQIYFYAKAFTDSDKCIQRMGSVICIFPDKVCFSTVTKTFTDMANTVTTGASVSVTLANATGGTINAHNEAYYETTKPTTGDYLITTSDSKSTLKEYSGVSDSWVTVYTTYVQLSATGIGTGFKKGDGVKITVDCSSWAEGKTLFPNTDDNVNYYNTVVLESAEANKITFTGLLATALTVNKSFKLERIVPDIAFVTEANNRLWGCNKEGTEIYACALGDATNWNCFEGISTDSWAMTVGSDGEFTGALTYNGYPTFFKENSLIKIAISSYGSHQSKETVCRGVAKGCGKSLAVVNELLFYKGVSSICSYDGSLPTTVSYKLGDLTDFNECVSGADKQCYVISGKQKGKYVTYIYDTTKGIFIKGDTGKYTAYANNGGELYAINESKVVCLTECSLPVTSKEGSVSSFVETKPIDYSTVNSKYIASFILKTSMDFGTEINIYIKYDNDVKWNKVANIKSRGTKVTNIPVRPKRCERFKLRIEGKGNYKIHQIIKVLMEGSNL